MSNGAAHRGVVWLDRDGTIVDDPGYLSDPDRLVLLDGAAEAIAALNRAGATVVLVTNQSGIGRGLMTRADVDAIHAELARRLAVHGAHLDDVRVCPHAPAAGGAGCDCRKPEPGLVLQARADLGIDAATPQVVVGDKAADVELARTLGVPAVLVLTGEGVRTLEEYAARPGETGQAFETVPSLAAGVDLVLRKLGLAGPAASC